jgi:hypothetical protein
MNRKSLIVVVLLAFAIGMMAQGETSGRQERPFLKMLALAARVGLGLMVFEPPPQDVKVHHEPDYVDHQRSL